MSEEASQKLGLDDPATGEAVIRACGWSPTVMTAAKKAGYVFKYGTRTTKRHFLAWRAANPGFTCTSYVASHSKTVRKRLREQQRRARAHSQRRSGHPAATAHTLHAQ